MVHYLLKQAKKTNTQPLKQEDKENIIKKYADNELLYLEAQKQGLDNDSRIKKQMIQKMTLLLTKEVQEPSEEELKAYFEEHKDLYATPEKRNFNHIFFAPGKEVPKDYISLIVQDEQKARTLADASLYFGKTLPNMSQRDLRMNFGQDAGETFIKIDDDKWHGPIVSILGSHFVKLENIRPKIEANYEDVKKYLYQQYIIKEHKKQLEAALVKLREQYPLEIQWPND